MDPNATLQRILSLASRLIHCAETAEGVDVDALDLAEAVENLDTWITRGGFLPERWLSAARTERAPSEGAIDRWLAAEKEGTQ